MEITDSEFKKKYNHCKKRVKQWEANFRNSYGRNPEKADIKQAEVKVKEYYKLYWQLKSAFLEQQILGEKPENFSKQDESEPPCRKERILTDHTDRNTPVSKKSDIAISEIEAKASDKLPEPEIKRAQGSSLKENIQAASNTVDKPFRSSSCIEAKKWLKSASMKLFEGSSFKKRNPRKSLSTNRTADVSNSTLTESFMSDISFQSSGDISYQPCGSPLMDNPTDSPMFSVENEVSPKIKAIISSSVPLSPMFMSTSKFSIVPAATDSVAMRVGLLSHVRTQSKPKSARQLDVGWVERCTEKAEKSLEESVSRDSGFESTGGNLSSPINDSPEFIAGKEDNALSSDDEIIYDSDDENNSQFLLSQKRKSSSLSLSQPVVTSSEQSTKRLKLDTESSNTQPLEIKQVPSHFARSKSSPVIKSSESKETLVKREIIEQKIKNGTLNENYVKINMKKKVYVRGKKNFNFSKHKRKEWKKKKDSASEGAEAGGVLRCFKCGDIGHYARRCMSTKEDKLLPVDDLLEDDLGLPSLADAEEMARAAGSLLPVRKGATLLLPEPAPEPEDLPELEGILQVQNKKQVPPLNPSIDDVHSVLLEFGHESFRPGQDEAVMRVLSGKSTLLMLSTGGGKSLCYQLPAYMYHKATSSIALVVSPLVSLMDDQVAGTMAFLKIGCLHTNLTEKQRARVLDQLKACELSALLVSPEAVVSCDNLGFGAIVKHLPPISFACIDEVHCVSQWSYNFRSSYLMLTKVLRERFGVTTFLGLTATASRTTVESIAKELRIEGPDGVIQDTPLPAHLQLSVSKAELKDAALLQLIKSTDGGATLVYCTRREECVRVATLIRTALKDVTAQPYHAGLAASRRKTVQKSFMQGKLQVVVATVAFGMGINKHDIRCVFHYNMPKDWESYVQEVGRAGRDGQPAKCHLLLDPKGGDVLELRRHILSNSVDRHMVRRLLARVFAPCDCAVGLCPGHEVAFSVADAVQAIDLPEENIATLLSYLQLHPDRLIQMLPPSYMTCRLSSYHGARAIHKAASECPPLLVAAAQAVEGTNASALTFDVIKLARQITWDSGTVKRYLKQTEWKKCEKGSWRRSGIHVQFSDLGLRVRSRGDLTPQQLDDALEYLMSRVNGHQTKALNQLQSIYSAFHFFSTDLKTAKCASRSDEIKSVIRTYFKDETLVDDIPLLKIQENDFDEEKVAADVRHLVCTFRDNTFNGRAIARIFYGIQSPNYPATIWFKARQWRAHLDKPFERLQAIATREILRLK